MCTHVIVTYQPERVLVQLQQENKTSIMLRQLSHTRNIIYIYPSPMLLSFPFYWKNTDFFPWILARIQKKQYPPSSMTNQITAFQYPSQYWQNQYPPTFNSQSDHRISVSFPEVAKISILPLSTANQITVFPYPSSLVRITMFSYSTNNLIATI